MEENKDDILICEGVFEFTNTGACILVGIIWLILFTSLAIRSYSLYYFVALFGLYYFFAPYFLKQSLLNTSLKIYNDKLVYSTLKEKIIISKNELQSFKIKGSTLTIFRKDCEDVDIKCLKNILEVSEVVDCIIKGIPVKQKNESVIQNIAVNNVSEADEIRKYKQLLDEGIITQEDFDKKKNELLSR